jgi:uncharacterized protein YigE (DUF2233 family)
MRRGLSGAMIVVAAMVSAGCGDRTRQVGADGGVTFRQAKVGGASYAVAEVDLGRADLRLYWKDSAGARYGSFGNLAGAMKREGKRVVFATNAGIFDRSFAPLGLHVEAGKRLVDLNVGEGAGNFYMKPNGVLAVDANGATIVDAATFAVPADPLRLAVQSGPLLVLKGVVHPAFARESDNRKIRSGVGVVDGRRVVFVLSESPVTFYEFATMMRDRLGCRDALYLDGEISKFYAPKAGWSDGAGDFAGILAVVADGG